MNLLVWESTAVNWLQVITAMLEYLSLIPQKPHGGMKEPILVGCLLTSPCAPRGTEINVVYFKRKILWIRTDRRV